MAIEKPTIALPLLMQLIGRHGHIKFDAMTKTKNVSHIVSHLTSESLDTYLSQLMTGFVNPSQLLSVLENGDSSRINALRKWILEQLALIIRTSTLQKLESQLILILKFVILHSFFHVKTNTETFSSISPPLSHDIQSCLREKLITLLGSLSSVIIKHDTPLKPGYMVNGMTWVMFASDVLREFQSDNNLDMIIELDETSSTAVESLLAKTDRIRKKVLIFLM